MTYNVFGETLNLAQPSATGGIPSWTCLYFQVLCYR